MREESVAKPECTRVSLVRCPSYQASDLEPALRRCLAGVGGLARFVQPGMRVFCKVNLLIPATPEQAVTTHPELLRAVIREIKGLGGIPLVGDNPSTPGTRVALARAGLLAVAKQEGAEVPELTETVQVVNPRSGGYRSFELSRVPLEADLLLNLPKLKTHSLCYLTLAVKNLYGLIPGLEKARHHFRAQQPEEFARLLVDLYEAVLAFRGTPPRLLHLLDGVLAMEGDGPGTGGTPRPVGVLLAADNALALDRVVCELVRFDPTRLATCRLGADRGLGPAHLAEVELVGDPLAELAVAGFVPPRGSLMTRGLTGRLMHHPLLRNRLVERPVLTEASCTGCRQCGNICPAGAIRHAPPHHHPRIDLDRCIRCYCCCEVCPAAALHKSDTPWLGRIVADPRATRTALLTALALAAASSAAGVGAWWWLR